MEDTMAPTLIGQRIAHYRTLRGIKQAALARRVGISPKYLYMLESGRRQKPGVILLCGIARELQVPLDWLACPEHEPVPDAA
jgi:transcriptional regulator with XRE-family HTH domain